MASTEKELIDWLASYGNTTQEDARKAWLAYKLEDGIDLLNDYQVSIAKIFLFLIIMIFFIEGGFTQSGWSASRLVLVLATILVLELYYLRKLVKIVFQGLTSLGDAVTSIANSFYKFLLSPLTRDYRAKEENYQEIIRGLQKQISEEQ